MKDSEAQMMTFLSRNGATVGIVSVFLQFITLKFFKTLILLYLSKMILRQYLTQLCISWIILSEGTF